MTYPMQNNFQRSQSKVWFGSNNAPSYSYYNDFLSLPTVPTTDSKQRFLMETDTIQELFETINSPGTTLNTTNISNVSNRQGSPSSHKSQDSGFSDAETSPNGASKSSTLNSTPNKNSESIIQSSPSVSDTSTIATPPTVIRRCVKPVYEEIRSSRRISFSAPSSPVLLQKSNSLDLLQQLEGINFNNTSPKVSNVNLNTSPCSSSRGSKNRSLKRSRVITKYSKINNGIMGCFLNASENSIDDLVQANLNHISDHEAEKTAHLTPYHNETIYFGCFDENTSSIEDQKCLDQSSKNDPLYMELNHPANTSTPKKSVFTNLPSASVLSSSIIKSDQQCLNQETYDKMINLLRLLIPKSYCYMNPLLNGNLESVQTWLDEVHAICQSEVTSTLQNKSISAEAIRSSTITSTTAVHVIKWLQKKMILLQVEFEKLQMLFDSKKQSKFLKITPLINSLVKLIMDFVIKQESHKKFYSGSPIILNKFLDNIRSIREMASDLNILTMKIDAEDMEDLMNSSIEEDVGILKRYFLITARLMFEHLIRIIVDNIEETKSDLILNANLMHLAQLSNFEYSGFASLNDAFVTNGTVRVLLLVCFESKHTKTRALALRALSTVCSTNETIHQLEMEGGVEILKDILMDQSFERSQHELREAISVLTQITAPWQASPHQLDGLKEFSEGIVESVLELVVRTTCCQTLLLCAACLNNISRMEPTSVYSLMSHDCINKLKLACDSRGPMASIFIYEQITTLILNMSSNRKSHHYLSEKHIISFLIASFQMKFGQIYSSLAENNALEKIILNIMQILYRLINESVVSQEVLSSNVTPVFWKIQRHLKNDCNRYNSTAMINLNLIESQTHKCVIEKATNSLNTISMDNNRRQSFV